LGYAFKATTHGIEFFLALRMALRRGAKPRFMGYFAVAADAGDRVSQENRSCSSESEERFDRPSLGA